MMGWRPHEVRACSLDDFVTVVEGYAEANGAKPEMSRDEARAIRTELGWE